ncbi:MAG: TasA family protein [Clostridiales bacterium]
MKKRNIIFVLLAMVMVVGISVGGTFAYLTDKDQAQNVFTIGEVNVELTETEWVPGDAQDLTANAVVAKNPVVKNIGKNPCLVRAKVTQSPSDIPVKYGHMVNGNFVEGINANWSLDNDYYYYKGGNTALAVNGSTEPIFTHVKIGNVVEANSKATFNIDIIVEAIQDNNLENKDAAWAEAAGLNK